MTEAQRTALAIQKRQAEIRARLGEIATIETASVTPEVRSEATTLQTELTAGETRLAAAFAAQSVEERESVETTTLTGEDRERAELRARVQIGEYVQAGVEQRGVAGAEAEYAAALNLRPGHFPTELLAPPAVETRATKTTTDGAANAGTWVDRLFAESAAARVGVTMQSVAPGEFLHMVTTMGASGAQRGRSEAAVDAPWEVGVTKLEPTRNAVRATFTLQDDFRLPGLEAALRRDLGAALVDAVDLAIFEGDSGADENSADVAGLQTLANVLEETLTQTNKVKAVNTLQAFLEFVDGKHAGGLADLGVVSSVPANVLWEGTLANAAASNQTIGSFLREAGVSWQTRADIASGTGNNTFGAFVGRRRGIAGAAIAAVWEGAQIIRDPYTNAAHGAVNLTMNYWWNFGLARATNFARIKFVSN